MVSQKVMDWVKQKFAEGYTSQQIKDSLVKEGYTVEEINEAMNSDIKSGSQVNTVSSPKKSNKVLLIIIVVIVAIVLICAGLYLFVLKDNTTEIINSTSQKDVNLVDANGNTLGQMHVDVNVDMQVTTETGYDDFKVKFNSCQQAKSEYKLSDTIIYYLEIIGPKEGLCEVKSKFTVNPNPEWINKEMTCLLDNSLDYETAVQDMSRCSGELYDLMTNPNSYQ